MHFHDPGWLRSRHFYFNWTCTKISKPLFDVDHSSKMGSSLSGNAVLMLIGLLHLQGYFYFWVILSFVWGLVAAAVATTLPIIESRFIIYAVAASTFPCFPFLKRWAAKEEHGLAVDGGSASSGTSSGQDPKVEQFMQQSAVGPPDGLNHAQAKNSDLHVIK